MSDTYTAGQKLHKIRPEHFKRRIVRIWLVPLRFLFYFLLWILVSYLLDAVFPASPIAPAASVSRTWLFPVLRSGLIFSVVFTVSATIRESREWRSTGFELEVTPDRLVQRRKGDLRSVYRKEVRAIREMRGFGRMRGLMVQADYNSIFILAGHPEYPNIKSELEEWRSLPN